VNVVWVAVGGASSYLVYRSDRVDHAYSQVASATGTSISDGGLTANTTYLYTVRAVGNSGPSDPSPVDAATTVLFTDDPLLAGATIVKAAHVNELRTGVNAMRRAANLSDFVFNDDPITAGMFVKAQHLTQLRQALDAARAAIGLTPVGYHNATITIGVTPVSATDLQELRAGVK
jgi:hypothetical protein